MRSSWTFNSFAFRSAFSAFFSARLISAFDGPFGDLAAVRPGAVLDAHAALDVAEVGVAHHQVLLPHGAKPGKICGRFGTYRR
jgi:hypothetical protein